MLDCPSTWLYELKNPDAPSKHWKEGRQLVIMRLYSMSLLTHSHDMINHGLHALFQGVWRCIKMVFANPFVKRKLYLHSANKLKHSFYVSALPVFGFEHALHGGLDFTRWIVALTMTPDHPANLVLLLLFA